MTEYFVVSPLGRLCHLSVDVPLLWVVFNYDDWFGKSFIEKYSYSQPKLQWVQSPLLRRCVAYIGLFVQILVLGMNAGKIYKDLQSKNVTQPRHQCQMRLTQLIWFLDAPNLLLKLQEVSDRSHPHFLLIQIVFLHLNMGLVSCIHPHPLNSGKNHLRLVNFDQQRHHQSSCPMC